MSINIPNFCAAMAKIDESASGVGVIPTFSSNAGFNPAGSIHSTTGVYSLVVGSAFAATQRIVQATVVDGTPADATVTASNTDSTTVTVQTRVAGSLSDAVSFNVAVFEMPNGVG